LSTSDGSRFLVATDGQPRARRAADVTSVLVGLLLLAWAAANHDRVGPVGRALTGLLAALPNWTTDPLSIVYSFGFLYAAGVVLALVVGGRRHLVALRDVLVALAVASVLGIVLIRVFQGSWPYVLPEIGLDTPERQTPVFRVAIVTAVLVAASPYLARPLRRLGWTIVVLSVVAGAGLGFGLPSDSLGAVGLGVLAAGATLLVLGSPSGYPDLATVAAGMARLGHPVSDLRFVQSRSWGVRPVLGRAADGTPLLLKAYGRDATDSQVLAKAWRSLWYREERRTFTFSRLQSVEHEALAVLWAARAGVPVPEVVTAGEASSEVALLALSTGGTRLDRLPVDELTVARLTAIWRDVARLHRAGVAHGTLTAATIRVDGDTHRFDELAAATVVARDGDASKDVVDLLVTLTPLVGAERAVRSAVAGLDEGALVAALPYLQLPALSGATRAQVEDPKAVLTELEPALVAATSTELPDRVPLRRVSPRTLVFAVLGIVAAWSILPAIAGIDLARVWDQLRDARWQSLLAALLVGQLAYTTEAAGMMFATPRPVPFRPLVVLQVAAKFLGIAAPGATGRLAANAAFLSRYGVSAAASLTQSSMDMAAGILVEATILLGVFTFTDLDLQLELDRPGFALGRVAVAVLVLVVVAGVVVARVPTIRERVVPVLRGAGDAVRSVVAQPTRALGLLAANLGTRVVHTVVLWLALSALDVRIGLGVALVVIVATSVLQGLVPVPGGIGVAEAVMVGFLVVLGVPEEPAFAATIVYRFVVFYLPIAQGAAALPWLRRNDHL
jgi:glycosyltransferase 2 family protein